MNNSIKKLSSFCVVVYCLSIPNFVHSISQNLWQPHSFSNGGTREILILQELNLKELNRKYFPEAAKQAEAAESQFKSDVDKLKMDKDLKKAGFLCLFGAAVEYTQNFGKQDGKIGLGALPFWSGTNSMTIGTNDGESDLDGYQFGLGETVTQGRITFKPKVQEAGVTFYNYCLQNKNKPGIYIKAKVTYGATYINPITCEIPAEESPEIIPGNELGIQGVYYPLITDRYKTLTEAFHSGFSYQMPLYRFGKIQRCRTKFLGTGDSSIVVGYNGIVQENAHAGMGIKFSYPMGNWPQGEFMLEPIFGTAGHPGLGLDLSAHYTHSMSDEGDQDVSFWLQADLMHYFPGRKPAFRSFDLLLNGPGSKYLLLQQYDFVLDDSTIPFGYVALPVPGRLVPAINITTLPVLASFPFEIDITAMVNYRIKNWDFGIALEMWGRAKETLEIDNCENKLYSKEPGYDYNFSHYAVAGRQIGASFEDVPDILIPRWCEPTARINKSAPYQSIVNNYPGTVKDATEAANRLPENVNKALDVEAARAHEIITGKFVGEVGYTALKHKNTPHFAIYGGTEISGRCSLVDNMWSAGFMFAIQY